MKRGPLDAKVVQRAVAGAARRAGIDKAVSPQVLRHSFATHLIASGHDICTVQQLPGHKHVETTMIYTPARAPGAGGVASPLDALVEPHGA